MALQRKKYLIPAIFSGLVIGLGQILKGDAKKGTKLILWCYMGFPILIYGSLLLNAYLFLVILAIFVIIYPIIWVLSITDAYSAQVYKKRK